MTRRTIPYGILTIAALGVALYTGDRFYYMLFALLLTPPLIGAAYALFGVWRLTYARSIEPSLAIKGETATLRLLLSNESFLPIPLLTVEYLVPGFGGEHLHTASMGLEARAESTVEETFTLRYRGVFAVGLRRVVMHDPFGLMRIPVSMEKSGHYGPVSLNVRPRIVPLREVPVMLPGGDGMLKEARAGIEDTSSPSATRAFMPGDPLKRVNWKMSVRARELMVRTYETPSQPSVYLFADLRPTGMSGESATAVEDMLMECVASMAYRLLSDEVPLRVVFYVEKRFEMEMRRVTEFDAFHESLATLPFTSPFNIGDVLKYERQGMLPGRNAVVLLSHSLDSDMIDQFMLLNKQSTPVTFIYVHYNMLTDAENTLLTRMTGEGVLALDCAPGDNIAYKLRT